MEEILKLDQEGYDKFLAEISKLENDLKEIRYYKGTDAIYQGDLWHDNPALDNAEMQERMLMRNIRSMKAQLRYIEIIEKGTSEDVADLGCVCRLGLTFADGRSGERQIRLVGGAPNLDAEVKEISINSPMGSAIYGKKQGEISTFEVEGRITRLAIISVQTHLSQ